MSDDSKPVKVTITVDGKEYDRIWFAAYQLNPDMIHTVIGGLGIGGEGPAAYASVLADIAHGTAAKFGIEPMAMLAMITMAFIGGELPDDTECVAIDLSKGIGVGSDGTEDDEDTPPPPRLQ